MIPKNYVRLEDDINALNTFPEDFLWEFSEEFCLFETVTGSWIENRAICCAQAWRIRPLQIHTNF